MLSRTRTAASVQLGGGPEQPLLSGLRSFREYGTRTRIMDIPFSGSGILPVAVNEFWTSKQRAAHSLHEISYRACFKPQLPRFFIERLTEEGDLIYDPFMGRGTTPLEAALLGRVPAGNDVNPLSRALVEPRLDPPEPNQIDMRLKRISLDFTGDIPSDLLVFYHHETLKEICALRDYFLKREKSGKLDSIDRWIRMVSINRLTGHSPGFFSVYTLPPNQAVSVESQRKINRQRKQVPPRRDVRALISRKTRGLLSDVTPEVRCRLQLISRRSRWFTGPAAKTPALKSGSVALVVTSPPFLDVVQYSTDNWLRCWFCGIDPDRVAITHMASIDGWQKSMMAVFVELHRILKPGGHVAFEVGEVRGGRVKLEETVIPAGIRSGFEPILVLINDQQFTKTANCWGVSNNTRGTNTNRIVVFRK
ncbi:MAG: site-specific DNA-methyltransferase [Deltaproteobacteria bacterium]|nr:site-specific DNA-methyltransferase [Deltaproteobacteria bacterium]